MPDTPLLTIGAAARRLGCRPWQVRRAFERGLLPPAPRVGAYRVIAEADLPRLAEALRAAGYLTPESGVGRAG